MRACPLTGDEPNPVCVQNLKMEEKTRRRATQISKRLFLFSSKHTMEAQHLPATKRKLSLLGGVVAEREGEGKTSAVLQCSACKERFCRILNLGTAVSEK